MTMVLSAREREIADLYSRGLSARRVAERCGISARTVETHVRHVYEKLGLHGRDELIERHEKASEG